jgi:branched-chain amino acid transport system substrate-binding protein
LNTTRRAALGGLSAAVTAAFLAACGSRSSSGSAASSSAAPSSSGAAAAPSSSSSSSSSSSAATGGGGTKTAKIGCIAPFTGSELAVGLGVQYGVKLAIDQANMAGTVKGWMLVLDAQSDDALTTTAQNAATVIASDPDVVGVIGTLNSSTCEVVQPILAPKDIVMVSPSNTNPTLTQGVNWETSKKRPYANYFRVCTTDAIQGPFAAQYVYNTLGIKKVATINDTKAYGKGLVETFTTEFTKLGGTITKSTTISPTGSTNYSSTVTEVKATKPGLVYYGGEYPQAGPLSKQMAEGGLNVPLMGGDGIDDPDYITLGGRAMDVCTSIGAPIESLASGKSFITAYDAAKFSQPYGPYGAYAYDAANAVIKALAQVLPTATSAVSAREAIVEAVQKTNFAGVTGTVSFDQYGDATNKTLTVYTVKGGTFVATKTGTFTA